MANEVKLKLSVDGARVVSQQIDGVTKNLGDMDRGANLAAVGMKKLTSMLGGFSAALTIGKLVTVQREFDVLNSSLITVTGSSAKAAQEFAWIKQFAATTPYQLNEVTGAFVKMKALGLDASAKSLASYGNTASAMGKGLNQMIEAVADAATGEFERLKEFGIKAKKSGDDVSLTFQGVTTNIGNNSAEITKYLQAIGNNEFAGAMATRAATLDGAISNLADTWDELFRTVNTNNAGTLIYDSVTLASGAINDAITVLNAMNGVAAESAKQTGAMATVQEALAITFETVAALAADFKYVLVQVGTEIGGLAAQAVQILQFNFAGAASIRQAMVSDAKTARAELDATQARILGARAAAQELASYNTRNASAASDPRRLDAETKVATAIATTTKLTKEQTAAVKAAAKAQAEAADYNTKAVDALYDAQEKTRLQVEDSIKTARTTLEQIEFETRLLEMNTEQRALATMERELERQGIVKGTLAYDAYIVKLREAMAIKSGKEAGIKAADDMATAQKKAAEESGKWWEDALMRAFESGKGFFESLWSTIKNTLKTQVLKVTVQGVMGSLGLGASGAAMAQTGGGILSSATGGFLGTSAGQLTIAGSSIAAIGSSVMTGIQAGWAGTSLAGAQAAYTAAGMGGVSTGLGVGSSIGSTLAAIPGWGWALAGVAALAGIASGHGETRSGATYDTGADGLARYQQGPSGGEIAGADARALFNATKTGIEETLKMVGSSATLTGFTAGLESSKEGKGFAFAGGYLDGNPFGDSDGREGHVSGQWSYQGYDAATAMKAYKNELNRSVLEALQIATDVPSLISSQLAEVDFYALTQEQLDGLVASVSGTINAVSSLVKQLNTSGIAELHDLSFAAAAGLIQFSGSIENLTTNLGSYYTNFYTEEEQRLQTIKNINALTLGSGLDAATASRDQFRALVEAQDLTTESGQKTYAALLSVSGAFAGLTPVLDSVADAWRKATDTIMDEVARIRGITSGSTTTYAGAQSAFTIATEQARAGDAAAAASLPELSKTLLELARENVSTLADYKYIASVTANSLQGTANMPRYDTGTNFVPQDGPAYLHAGEAVVPRTYNPSAGGGASKDARLHQLIERLTAEVEMLRAEVRSDVSHNAKTARLLERVMPDGDALATRVAA